MRDLIFAQSIPQKVGARPGTKVDVMISRGPTTTYTLMPSLIGLTLDEARVRVENAGLALGVVRKKRSDFDANIVIEQGTPAYERTPHGGAVNVTIADPNAPIEELDESSDEGSE